VFVPGSGCAPVRDQMTGFFRGLPGHWRIVALEKPGLDGQLRIGCSSAFHAATDYAALITRNTQFAAHVLAHNPTAPRKVLVGYSEGGTVAPFVAASAAGFSHVIVAAAGAMPGELETRLSFSRIFGAGQADAIITEIKAAPRALDRYALGETFRYWASLFALTPMSAYQKVGAPILMLHGEKDHVVPVETTRYAVAQFAKQARTNLTAIFLRDAGHGLYASDGAKRAAMWRDAAAWLARHP
jgi:predicted esterase